MEVFKTLLLHGEMDTIFSICANPNTAVRSWWQALKCFCGDGELGWSRVARMALDSYILLNVIHCFPATWDGPLPHANDYRRARSYQFLVWRDTCSSCLVSEVVTYPARQFFGIGDGQFTDWPKFRDAKRWSHLQRGKPAGTFAWPFGHMPYEVFLECQQQPINHEPSVSDMCHVRWILYQKQLPVEIADIILKLAAYQARRRLPVPGHPFHAENREELSKYLTYCWQLLIRCEMTARELSMRINWQNWIALSIDRIFNCRCGNSRAPKLFSWTADNEFEDDPDKGQITFN